MPHVPLRLQLQILALPGLWWTRASRFTPESHAPLANSLLGQAPTSSRLTPVKLPAEMPLIRDGAAETESRRPAFSANGAPFLNPGQSRPGW